MRGEVGQGRVHQSALETGVAGQHEAEHSDEEEQEREERQEPVVARGPPPVAPPRSVPPTPGRPRR